MTLLEVTNVQKQFVGVKAVDGLSLAFRRGEVFGLLGPNGAGKTTLIRMLLGMIRPDSGSIRFYDGDAVRPHVPATRVGYLPEERGLYQDMPILETLKFLGGLRGMTCEAATQAGEQWLKRLDLHPRRNDKLKTLSKGNQQKVQLASALLHRPVVAILDEPFSGLDPSNQEFLLTIIRELRAEGMTILLSAHQMQLVERLADRVLLVNHGREILSGTMAEVRQRGAAERRLRIRHHGVNPPTFFLPNVRGVETPAPGELVLLLDDAADISPVLRHVAEQIALVDVRVEEMSLHDIYLQSVGAHGRNAEASTALEPAS